MNLKGDICTLRSDVDQLKYTNFFHDFWVTENSYVPDIPSTSSEDEFRIEEIADPEFEAETYE